MILYSFQYTRFVCGKLHEFSRQFHSKKEYDEVSLQKLVNTKWGKEAKLLKWDKQPVIKNEL